MRHESNRLLPRAVNGEPVEIMLYFKDEPIAPSKIDNNQLGKINAFKERIGTEMGGVYHVFQSTEDFKTSIRSHLTKIVQEWDQNQLIESKNKETNLEVSEEDRNDNLGQ